MDCLAKALDRSMRSGLIVFGGSLLLMTPSAYAEITPDQTLGAEASRVRVETDPAGVDTTLIESGAIRNDTLFHSFLQFDVDANQRVFFAPPANITNIFSRVTGSTASQINGTLGVNGSANLFLINPQGIVFGPNATLDLGGSFLATTADSFDWGNGLTFSAIAPNPAPSLLNVGITPGLQYGQGNSGSLVSEANLETNGPLELASQTLELRGSITTNASDVTLRGTDVTLTDMELFTRLEQGQVGKAGDVRIEGDRITINGPSYISTEAFGQGDGGKIELVASENILLQSLVPEGGNAFQLRQRLDSSVHEAGNAGEIRLSALTVTLDNADLLSELERDAIGSAGDVLIDADTITMDTVADIETQSFGQGNGGDITLQASTIDILGSTELTTRLQPEGVGKAGDLKLEADTIRMREQSKLRTQGFGEGDGGRIELIGRDRIELVGKIPEGEKNASRFRILIDASSQRVGSGGDIVMTTPNLLLDNTDLVSNLAARDGNAGNISLVADIIKMDNFADLENQSFGQGNGGNVRLQGREIELAGNTEITTRLRERAEGKAGDVLIEADRLKLRQNSKIQAETVGKGNAGNVTINVPGEIILKDFSEIDVRNDPNKGKGNSGRIEVTGGSMTLKNSPLLAQVLGVGTGQGIAIDLTGDLLIDGRKRSSGFFTGARQRSVAPPGEGAGPLSVRARNIEMQGGSARIQGGTIGNARGGTVTVNVENNLKLTGNARILSSADAGAKQDARDMVITAKRIELLDKAIFESATRADVNAGKITIITGELRLDDQGQIVASTTEKGNAAPINITATRSLEVLKDSVIYSGVDGGTGNGADLNITAGDVILQEGGRIEAQTEGSLPNLIADSISGVPYDEVIQRSNPVAYWKLDNTDGAVADSSRRGSFNGSEEGGAVGSSTDAISGRSAQFDGDGPGGVLRIDPDLDLEKTVFFVEAWVKPDPTAGGARTIVSVIDESNNSSGFSLRLNNERAVNVNLDSGGSFRKNAIPQDGQWHHVVTRIGGDLKPGGSTQVTVTDYVDGRQIQGGSNGSLRLEDETLRIGGWKGPDSLPFQGLIDEVAIYKSDELPRSTILPIETHYIAGRLSLDPDFQAEVPGEAIAGNININANNIDIAGVSLTSIEDLRTRGKDFRGISSGIFSGSETEFSGPGGNINLNVAESLNLDDAGVVSALTNSIAKAGNIDITANTVNLSRGGQVLATSSSTGNAGDINVGATRINISDLDSQYQDRFEQVDTPSIRIDVDRANSGIITSNRQGNGGNITLSPSQLLTLRDQGLIRTDSGGDGGDIRINNQTGFILAIPDENSDITANANQGAGGNINIATQGIFGIQFREEESPFTSDITASSQFGINGTVDVDVLNIDPSQGLAALPTNVTDPSNQISRSCSPQSISQTSFTQTGRGGLPASPVNPLRSRSGVSDWIVIDAESVPNADMVLDAAHESSATANESSAAAIATPPKATPQAPATQKLTEARNWSIQDDGSVQLLAAEPLASKALDCATKDQTAKEQAAAHKVVDDTAS